MLYTAEDDCLLQCSRREFCCSF